MKPNPQLREIALAVTVIAAAVFGIGAMALADPSGSPSDYPSGDPSGYPSDVPSGYPSWTPSPDPSGSWTPSPNPSGSWTPSPNPSGSQTPSPNPSGSSDPAHAGTVTGHFTRPDGSPVSYGSVTAYTPDYRYITGAPLSFYGEYSLSLPAGQYVLEFNGSGLVRQFAHGKRDFWTADRFTVADRGPVVVDEVAMVATQVSGRLTDAAGNPVAYSSVNAQGLDNQGYGYAQTDYDGRYSMLVSPGPYRVSFTLGYNSNTQQYVPQKKDYSSAGTVTVPSTGSLELNEQLLPFGYVSGQITTAHGDPVNGWISFQTGDGALGNSTSVYGGQYRIALFSGSYIGQVNDYTRSQYLFDSRDAAHAATLTVTPGETLVANDQMLPAGKIKIVAKDAVTGNPVAGFCAGAGERYACAQGTATELLLDPVTVGETTVDVNHALYKNLQATTTVTADATVLVEVSLRPASVLGTTVRSAVTGQPVANACVVAYATNGDGQRYVGCSDDHGVVKGKLDPGTWRFFVNAPWEGGYGSQWLGKDGHGTGDMLNTKTVKVYDEKSAVAPDIRLDQGGSVTGTVTDEVTGAPVEGAHVGLQPFGFAGSGSPNGVYHLDNVGPYNWPLHVIAAGYANEWSGDSAFRTLAATVKVTSGQTASYDFRIGKGTTVIATVPSREGGWVCARTVLGGDIAGCAYYDPATRTYTLHLSGPQKVTLSWQIDGEGAGTPVSGQIAVTGTGTKQVSF
ncbi:carboxypeptidase regulatory-like domain-containing protein [Longispora sp. K20-0274]|uniref:carboxypeptidase-like regulatory domain-containing protein n=1 Tax=Longispora sp. K20-0274 TaxID=3088255 RepID=UPI003999BA08